MEADLKGQGAGEWRAKEVAESTGRETEPETSSCKPGVRIAVNQEYLTGSRSNVVRFSPVRVIDIVNSPKKAYISDWFSLRYDTGLRDHMLFSVVFFFSFFLPKLSLT